MNTTIRGESSNTTRDFWTDHATVLRREAANGLLAGFAQLYGGTMADMVRRVSSLPAASRADLIIEKAGDRQYGLAEIMLLALRADFPR